MGDFLEGALGGCRGGALEACRCDERRHIEVVVGASRVELEIGWRARAPPGGGEEGIAVVGVRSEARQVLGAEVPIRCSAPTYWRPRR